MPRTVLAALIVVLSTPFAAARDAPQLAFGAIDPALPSVAIVATGGTIAERTDPATGGAVPAISGADLVRAVPDLSKLANIGMLSFSDIDSSQMTPALWARLSVTVDALLAREDIAGVVVSHGTDTMAEGAYFLDLTLSSDKPVVFTGAMRDVSEPSPDGSGNLLNAVTQVLSPAAQGWGVTVTLNGYVNAARDVRKTQTTNVQTFTSGEKGYLGYIFGGVVQRFNDRTRPVRLALPDPLPDNMPDVPLIESYAGSDGRLVRHAVETGAVGLVIEGVGAGNVDAESFAVIQEALAKGLPVVIATRVPQGAVEPIYGDTGGGRTLQEAGAILAGDLDAPKARLLLMAGLMQHGADPDALRALFDQ